MRDRSLGSQLYYFEETKANARWPKPFANASDRHGALVYNTRGSCCQQGNADVALLYLKGEKSTKLNKK